MISVSNDFKTRTKKIKQQNIKLGIVDGELTVKEVHFMPVKQFNALPVWMLRKRQEVIAKELKYSFDGNLFKTTMKQIEITVKNAKELKGKNVNFQYGLRTNNDFEYINLGDYYIKDVDDDKGKKELVVTGYDKMIHFMKTFKQSELQLTYPCKMLTLIQKMCEVCGVELYSTNFFNANLDVNEDYFTAQELTYRDVLEKVAESTLTTIFIKDNKLYLHKLADNPVEKLDASYLTGLTVKEKFGPVNALVLGRGDVEDNVEAKDDTSIAQNGRCEIRFDENEFVEYQREQVIDEMFEQIKGLEYYAFESSDVGVMWLEPCDLIEVEDNEESTYETIYLKTNITINTGISSDIEADILAETNTEYKVTTKEEKRTLKVERLAKKNEGLILDVIEEQTETSQKLTQVEQTVDGITQKVQDIENLTKTTSGYTTVTLENCLEGGQVVEIHIYGNNTVFKYTRFSSNTIFGEAIFNGNSNISVTNKDGIKKIYDLGVKDVLRQNEETCDEYVLGIDGKGKVIRRVNEDGTTKTTQVEEEANDLTIFLDEGNNILKIESYYANLEVKYIEKNAYTDTFATEVQMNSTITQTAQEIETNVNKKLENYSTTEEMNSTIEQTAESIQSNVNKKLEDYSTTEEMNSTITQTAETINTEVSKKAGKNEVCSIVSQSADAINIKANRISIESTNFKLSKEGAIEATEGEIGGFQLGTNTFLTNFSGLYDYNEHDFRLAVCALMDFITIDSVLTDILDVNQDNYIDTGDTLRIRKIILGNIENTKNVSGTLEINTQNPKNNIAIKKDGQLVVALGAGGVNTKTLTAENAIIGSSTETAFNGVAIDGNLGKISIIDNNNSNLQISKDGIKTPSINTSEDIDVGGNLLVDTGVIHSLYTYEHDNTTTSPNMYISSYGNIRRTTNTSSRRYKTEVKDIEDENLNPENLYKLKIRQFKYKTDYFSNKKDERYNKNLIGFIAEEVADIFPVAADYETDKNGNKYVENWNEKYIIPAMLKLIQDQHIEIEELKKRVEKLEGGV